MFKHQILYRITIVTFLRIKNTLGGPMNDNKYNNLVPGNNKDFFATNARIKNQKCIRGSPFSENFMEALHFASLRETKVNTTERFVSFVVKN